MRRSFPTTVLPLLVTALLHATSPAAAQVTAIRAGGLVDPDSGTRTDNVVILVENGRFGEIGTDIVIPSGALVVDLSDLTVVPGLVDARAGAWPGVAQRVDAAVGRRSDGRHPLAIQ